MILQNYVKPNYCKLKDIIKTFTVDEKINKLRGVIVFHSGQKGGLRTANGHYTACTLRSNDKWEHYDDTRDKVQHISESYKNDIEFLIFTM
jgi:ubiquitin C-terminal hydrolase